MATGWPASVDVPHDPVAGESMASGTSGDLAQEITNVNDRTVAMQNSIGVTNNPGNMGFRKLIGRQVLASAVASVTFSSIPQTFENLHLEVTARSSFALSSRWIQLQFNGDVGTNYFSQYMYANGASGAPAISSAQSLTAGYAVYASASTAPANLAGSGSLDITGYARTTFDKTWRGISLGPQATSGATALLEVCGSGVWISTAAITSITFLIEGGGNFVIGSVFSLYGDG